jgi:hypothetical protein
MKGKSLLEFQRLEKSFGIELFCLERGDSCCCDSVLLFLAHFLKRLSQGTLTEGEGSVQLTSSLR